MPIVGLTVCQLQIGLTRLVAWCRQLELRRDIMTKRPHKQREMLLAIDSGSSRIVCCDVDVSLSRGGMNDISIGAGLCTRSRRIAKPPRLRCQRIFVVLNLYSLRHLEPPTRPRALQRNMETCTSTKAAIWAVFTECSHSADAQEPWRRGAKRLVRVSRSPVCL